MQIRISTTLSEFYRTSLIVGLTIIPYQLHIIDELFNSPIFVGIQLFLNCSQIHWMLDYCWIVGQIHSLPINRSFKIIGFIMLSERFDNNLALLQLFPINNSLGFWLKGRQHSFRYGLLLLELPVLHIYQLNFGL